VKYQLKRQLKITPRMHARGGRGPLYGIWDVDELTVDGAARSRRATAGPGARIFPLNNRLAMN